MTDVREVSPVRIQLIIAIATNPLSEELIDEVYNEKSGYYYDCYYNSSFFEHPVFRLYPTHKYMYIKKTAGIYADAVERNNYELVIKLMRRGYNALYQYIRKAEIVDMERAINISLRGEKIERVDEESLGNIYVVIFYILEIFNKQASNTQGFIYWTRRFLTYLDDMTKATENHAEVTKYFKDVRKYYKTFRIKESDYDVGNILDNLIERNTEERIKAEGLDISTISSEEYVVLRSDTFKSGGIASVVGMLSGMYKYMGFSELMLNQEISKSEFDLFLSKYLQLISANNIPEELHETLLLSSIMAFALSKEYHYTRNEALDTVEKMSHMTNKVEKEKDRKRIKNYKSQTNELKRENKRLKKKLKNVEDSNKKISKELNRTQKELDKNKKNEKELIALRSHLFKLQQNEQKLSQEDSDAFTANKQEYIEQLSALDIIIVGGHSNWVSNMRNPFPDFTYISGESVNTDLSMLDRKGAIVFLNTDNNTHAQYERVVSVMNKNDNNFHYISGLTNIDRTIAFMIDKLEL